MPSGGLRGRLVFGVIGLGIVLLVIFVFYSIFGGSGFDASGPTSVAQTQHEVVRVAAEAGPNTTQLSTSSLAINVQLTVQTQQTKLLAYLGKQGKKVSAKTLGLKQNANIDQQLSNAQQNSTYDVTFTQIMQNELQSYAGLLANTYAKATGKNERALLATDYAQVQMLLKEVPSTQSLQ